MCWELSRYCMCPLLCKCILLQTVCHSWHLKATRKCSFRVWLLRAYGHTSPPSLLSQGIYCELLGLITRKWVCETCMCREIQSLCAKGNLCPLCHSGLTLWTLCCRPTHPSVCPNLYIPAWECSFWLVSLRYDIPSGVGVCVCVCVSLAKNECSYGALALCHSPGVLLAASVGQSDARTLNSLLYRQKYCSMSTSRTLCRKPAQKFNLEALRPWEFTKKIQLLADNKFNKSLSHNKTLLTNQNMI